jgi:5-(carboxyamino)imidazole ribonucleotide synthase
VTSQFEQQARVLCSVPLGDTSMHCPAVMVNLLGDLWAAGEPKWEHVLRHGRAKLHLYGKTEARPGRKMGHYTVLAEDVEHALATAIEIKSLLLADAQAHRAAETQPHRAAATQPRRAADAA